MARLTYTDNYRAPTTSNFVIILILVNHWGMFPVAHSSWLFFGRLQDLTNTIGPRICDQMSLVPKQKAMCLEDPKVMASVGEGAFNGIEECQNQFKKERWNCSVIEKGQTVFGKVINAGSREGSFVHAITAAGVMYSVTRACSRGDVNSCSCDRRKHGESADGQGKFTWGGCSDDIGNGTYFVREFVDASEVDVHDARAEMNLHNNRAGRRAVKKFVKRQCKCHGKTGSCSLRTCWESLGDFRLTGDYLKQKYDEAVRVTVTQNGQKGDLVGAERGTPPNKNDLVFLEDSPDYCVQNKEVGIYGTAERECNKTSTGNDGCETLCCGRGFTTKKIEKTEDCMCEFHWCCEVRCKKCTQVVDVHTCRGEGEESIIIPTTLVVPSATDLTITTKKPKRRKKDRRRNKGRKRKGKGRKGKSKKRNKRSVSQEVTDNYKKSSMLWRIFPYSRSSKRFTRARTVIR